MSERVSEWHVMYQNEWAIHRPTGRLRHLVCKRDIEEFSRFKSTSTILIPVMTKGRQTGQMIAAHDPSLHHRREILMQRTEPFLHLCNGADRFDEIEEITIPTMVVEIALCYMKI